VRAAAGALLPTRLLVLRGPSAARQVALTFDDGPDATTGSYLDVLDRFGARATFFVLGDAAAARRDVLLEIVRRGHEVASHGYSHRRFPTLSAAELRDELERTAAALPPPRGHPLVRPPQGATSLGSLSRTALYGYTTVLWSLDSDDCRTDSPEAVAARVAPARVRPGEIVLLHEGQSWTLEALPAILGGLKGAGYSLVTVGELLGL
jgi:peptidoglycan/xylan/chitin deacetylase (PgdA/CDA1 family)